MIRGCAGMGLFVIAAHFKRPLKPDTKHRACRRAGVRRQRVGRFASGYLRVVNPAMHRKIFFLGFGASGFLQKVVGIAALKGRSTRDGYFFAHNYLLFVV
jgi:hypothetical protein